MESMLVLAVAWWGWILIVIGALIVGVIVIGVLLPKRIVVMRSATINATPTEVGELTLDLKCWRDWGVWYRKDPAPETSYGEVTRGNGAFMKWTDKSGEGSMTVTKFDEASGIEFDMLFGEKWKSEGLFKYRAEGEGTIVEWTMISEIPNPVFRVMMALFNFKKAIARDFDGGLKNLKELVEKK